MKRKRGFILILCLLMAGLLLVLVVAMLSLRGPAQEAANASRWSAQAHALAEAGMEDCRAKLSKDLRFPPAPTPENPSYAYSEAVYDVDNSVVGYFSVLIDQSLDRAPFYVYRLRVTGSLGDLQKPLAQKSIYEEIDTAPTDRTNPTLPNTRRFRALSIQELP